MFNNTIILFGFNQTTFKEQVITLLEKPPIVIGALFMFFLLLLLIYANFCYKYTYKQMLLIMLKWRICSCLKCCFVIRKKNTNTNNDITRKKTDEKNVSTVTDTLKISPNVYDTEISQNINSISTNHVKTKLVRKPSSEVKTVNFIGIGNNALDKDDVIIWV